MERKTINRLLGEGSEVGGEPYQNSSYIESMKSIVITGASSGIGLSLSRAFLSAGYRVYGSVRKQADADRLRTELGGDFRPLLFDVTDHEAVATAAEQVKAELDGQGLAGLINNAGIAVSGPLMHVRMEELRKQFEVNVFGVMAVTQAFLPLLGAVQNPGFSPGRIVMISSISGRLGAPFVGPYCGSKFALEGLTGSLRRELQLYGIKVISILPGPIQTPIWDKPSATDLSEFEGTDFAPAGKKFQKYMLKSGKEGMNSDVLAGRVLKAFEARKPKVAYVHLKGKFKNYTLPSWLSARTIDKAIAKSLSLFPGGKAQGDTNGRFG